MSRRKTRYGVSPRTGPGALIDMLAKANRLTKDKEFDGAFRGGRSSYDGVTGVKAAANKSDNSRFGIIVNNKISKKAVERNRVKRQIRDIVRKRIDRIKPGYDCVIISLPNILSREYKEIEQSINRHFIKLKLFK